MSGRVYSNTECLFGVCAGQMVFRAMGVSARHDFYSAAAGVYCVWGTSLLGWQVYRVAGNMFIPVPSETPLFFLSQVPLIWLTLFDGVMNHAGCLPRRAPLKLIDCGSMITNSSRVHLLFFGSPQGEFGAGQREQLTQYQAFQFFVCIGSQHFLQGHNIAFILNRPARARVEFSI